MDKETELRRRINYLTDFIQKSKRAIAGDSRIDYYDYYQNYKDVVTYLKNVNDGDYAQLPKLIAPGFYNKRLNGFWVIGIYGLFNPFLAGALMIATFPVSIPLLVLRIIMLRRTKNRIEDLEVFLLKTVAKLKEQQLAMIMNDSPLSNNSFTLTTNV